MANGRKAQLICGLTTGVLGLVIPFFRSGLFTVDLSGHWMGILTDDLVFFVMPGLLVSVGAYLHVLKGKRAGILILLLLGLFLTAMGLVHLSSGVFFVYGLIGGVLILTQSFLAMSTAILSLVNSKIRNAETG